MKTLARKILGVIAIAHVLISLYLIFDVGWAVVDPVISPMLCFLLFLAATVGVYLVST